MHVQSGLTERHHTGEHFKPYSTAPDTIKRGCLLIIIASKGVNLVIHSLLMIDVIILNLPFKM